MPPLSNRGGGAWRPQSLSRRNAGFAGECALGVESDECDSQPDEHHAQRLVGKRPRRKRQRVRREVGRAHATEPLASSDCRAHDAAPPGTRHGDNRVHREYRRGVLRIRLRVLHRWPLLRHPHLAAEGGAAPAARAVRVRVVRGAVPDDTEAGGGRVRRGVARLARR
eukprot:7121450-Prymnesium_polylepis.1